MLPLVGLVMPCQLDGGVVRKKSDKAAENNNEKYSTCEDEGTCPPHSAGLATSSAAACDQDGAAPLQFNQVVQSASDSTLSGASNGREGGFAGNSLGGVLLTLPAFDCPADGLFELIPVPSNSSTMLTAIGSRSHQANCDENLGGPLCAGPSPISVELAEVARRHGVASASVVSPASRTPRPALFSSLKR